MNDINRELLKQAISEGLSNRLDNMSDSCTEAIVCSEKHMLAMRTIVYGKIDKIKKPLSMRAKRIIAILVAAAILLTSCGIIFREGLREIFEDIYVAVTYETKNTIEEFISEVYAPTYIPEGYSLKGEWLSDGYTEYFFSDENGDEIYFKQGIIDEFKIVMDNESGYSETRSIGSYELYYRVTNSSRTYHHYVWHNEKYLMKLTTSEEFSNEELLLILDGIKVK